MFFQYLWVAEQSDFKTGRDIPWGVVESGYGAANGGNRRHIAAVSVKGDSQGSSLCIPTGVTTLQSI
jgi:hypothetical protein